MDSPTTHIIDGYQVRAAKLRSGSFRASTEENGQHVLMIMHEDGTCDAPYAVQEIKRGEEAKPHYVVSERASRALHAAIVAHRASK